MTSRTVRDQDFEAFVVARSARLMHIAHMLCGDRGQAEDHAQTALEKAYAKWDRIQLADPFAYVRQVVINECRMSWRRRPVPDSPLDPEADHGPGPATHVADPAVMVTQRLDLLAALATLTGREREVVVLRYVERLSEAETAQLVGIAPGTVKSTLARARVKLRRSPNLSSITPGDPT
jgi:RNA polymerase sigma-70 factor (sigma-E family)